MHNLQSPDVDTLKAARALDAMSDWNLPAYESGGHEGPHVSRWTSGETMSARGRALSGLGDIGAVICFVRVYRLTVNLGAGLVDDND